MTTTGWRYTLSDGRHGTLVGPKLDTREQAQWELEHRFGHEASIKNLQRSGSEELPVLTPFGER